LLDGAQPAFGHGSAPAENGIQFHDFLPWRAFSKPLKTHPVNVYDTKWKRFLLSRQLKIGKNAAENISESASLGQIAPQCSTKIYVCHLAVKQTFY
jgi:hypothetical protein